ncbi:capsid assembly scaffolding protein Gp46 family protein, partial [Bacillus subtilis]
FERNAKIEKMRTMALKTASEKKIPADLVDLFVSEKEEATLENLTKFEEAMKPYIQEQVEDRLKNSSYTPPSSNNNNQSSTSLSNFMSAIYENQTRK